MKIGIVTGVGKGLGQDICIKLLKKKYLVIGVSKSNNLIITNLKKKYNNFIFYKQDLSKKKKTEDLFKKIFNKYNNISFLVNNSGIRFRRNNKASDYKTYQKVLDNNFFSACIITNLYLKYLEERSFKIKSSIVSITSIVGPNGFDELSNYAASKGALEYYMRSLAIEFAEKNVRINNVAPGFIMTDYYEGFKKNKNLHNWTIEQTPMKRWGKKEEVSNVVEFLLSNKSSFITGNTIFVDGGWNFQ